MILYVNCFGRTVLYRCIEYHIYVNMYHVSAQGVDERMINAHYYYYFMLCESTCGWIGGPLIIMYIYHAFINALSAHMIHINLNMMFYRYVEDSPTKTIYISL